MCGACLIGLRPVGDQPATVASAAASRSHLGANPWDVVGPADTLRDTSGMVPGLNG